MGPVYDVHTRPDLREDDVLLRLVGAGMRRLFRWSVAMATEFLAVCFQVMMFALTFGLALAGYAWLVTP